MSSFIVFNRILIFFNCILIRFTDEFFEFIIFSIWAFIPIILPFILLFDDIISSIFSVFNFIFSPHFGQVNPSSSFLYTNTFIILFSLSNELACSSNLKSKFSLFPPYKNKNELRFDSIFVTYLRQISRILSSGEHWTVKSAPSKVKITFACDILLNIKLINLIF